MDITINTVDQITVVAIAGDIDGKTAPEAQRQIASLVRPGVKILLDVSQVSYMSSAGLRMLLSTYRQVSSNEGRTILVGLSEDVRDTMSLTGFLRFFTVYETVDEGLAALQ